MDVSFDLRFKTMTCQKNIILFRIKSAMILKKKTVYNKFLKITIKCYGDEATDFHNTESPKMGSNHTYLAVIRLNCALKR